MEKEILYKVTYSGDSMLTKFVRIKDDAILYANHDEWAVVMFARGFCQAKGCRFMIE